jgi:hypothetical protein
MEYLRDYLERNHAFFYDVPAEVTELAQRKYYAKLHKRINYCKKLLISHKDPFIYYTIAELYNRDAGDDVATKDSVRYYCLKVIRRDPKFAPAWALLAEAYSWIVFINNKVIENFCEEERYSKRDLDINHNEPLSKKQKSDLQYIEKAICCIKKAIKLDQFNEEYKDCLKHYYQIRKEALERDPLVESEILD